MNPEDNKAIVRRFNEQVISRGDIAAVDLFLDAAFTNRSVPPGLPEGREGVKQLFGAFHAAFAGFHVTIEDQVAEGDRVVTRKTFHGTHEGEFFGIPATSKQVAFGVIDILRLADGKIVEHWNVVDQLGLMQQLGVVPQPEEATA